MASTSQHPKPDLVMTSSFLNGLVSSARQEQARAELLADDIYLVLLNWRLPTCLPQLWTIAGTRVCADGGANRLHDELPLLLPEEPAEQVLARHLPDLVLGDMDSLRPPVRDFFTTRGVCVRPSDDQDTTDLHKCLAYVQQDMQLKRDRRGGGEDQALSGPSPASGSAAPQVPGGRDPSQAPPDHLVLVLGALGGRLDHTLGNLAVLHSFPNLNLALLGEGNMVRLVPPGLTLIMPNKQVEGPHCGLIPIAGPARVTFSGLRWNLDNAVMQVGGLVSTSNLLQDDEVWVHTDAPLLWTTQLSKCMELNVHCIEP